MKTAITPTPPAAESALTPAPMIAYFDPAIGDDCGWIAIYRNDDTPTASLVSRLMDTPANRQYAALIVEAVNAHAAAQQRIVELALAVQARDQTAASLERGQNELVARVAELEKALGDALPLLALLAGKNDTMAEAAWQHGLAALRHPERT